MSCTKNQFPLYLIEAVAVYQAELVKYSAVNLKVDAVIQEAQEAIASAQCTAFESQLCRCLRKDKSEQPGALRKYLAMYADVPPGQVQKHLWAAAQKTLK